MDVLKLTVNGSEREVPAGWTVADLVRDLSVGAKRFAVERNQKIVPRSALSETRIEPGDVVEIVTFVGGG